MFLFLFFPVWQSYITYAPVSNKVAKQSKAVLNVCLSLVTLARADGRLPPPPISYRKTKSSVVVPECSSSFPQIIPNAKRRVEETMFHPPVRSLDSTRPSTGVSQGHLDNSIAAFHWPKQIRMTFELLDSGQFIVSD